MDKMQLQQAADGIGDRVRSARKDRGLTQAQLAALAGTNQAVIQKIEKREI